MTDTPIVYVSGYIEKIISKYNANPIVFKVITQKGNSVLVEYETRFFPGRENDIFDATCFQNKDRYRVIDGTTPNIETPDSRFAVISAIKKALGKNISPRDAEKLYDEIKRKVDIKKIDIKSIIDTYEYKGVALSDQEALNRGVESKTTDYIDRLALSYNQIKKQGIEEQLKVGTEFSQIIHQRQYWELMTWWYKNVITRKLWTLGFNNKLIEECKFFYDNLIDLYEASVKNPYAVAPIPLDLCFDICVRKMRFDLIEGDLQPVVLKCAEILRHVYNRAVVSNWCCIPNSFMINEYPDYLDYAEELMENYGLEIDMDCTYLSMILKMETTVAEYLSRSPCDDISIEEVVIKDPKMTEEQKQGVQNAFKYSFSVITGGAGTGKTTVIKEIINNCVLNDIPYAIVAPTGKAASRAKEANPGALTATIHRMMARPLDANFRMLVVDESSMFTLSLFYQFIQRFPHNFKIVFVGDKNQLEPIGYGSLFAEIIKSKVIPITELTVNYRSKITGSDGVNAIVENATAIAQIMDARTEGILKRREEFDPHEFITADNFYVSEEETIKDFVKYMRINGITRDQFAIVNPFKKDLHQLNTIVQQIYHEGQKLVEGVDYHLDSRRVKWALNDRVMMKANSYNIGIMNGDSGKIVEITKLPGGSELKVERSGSIVKQVQTKQESKNAIVIEWYNKDRHTFVMTDNEEDPDLSEYDDVSKDTEDVDDGTLSIKLLCHASALTVHKSQGSEWDYVVLYLPPGNTNLGFINSNMIYTAITRAKLNMILLGNIESMSLGAVRASDWRCENLGKRLAELLRVEDPGDPEDPEDPEE